MTITVPVKPEHVAMPVVALMDTPLGVIPDIEFESDHITGVAAVIGAMLKFPIALN